ncbi:uncharacterized protein PGTG_02913 [Puccinia graminis f. sp. tritici CRL 75-36-700-3]|uniref:Arginine biosynthesis bifunctional protein ArgJ, mitochondrial n=1 Tax=Puccinia graminis f. sp. tritici (strain CRL 75-36-700-3 / race SCCL) TaxID=418459 RepID=E3JWP7_PUCGT|nr:uncharacterized protein PGTG_02913 [Puccinia graminis f. sp. tritici CRL 75-36-700-3]EFP76472.2 hypothetical protein PGTG_02913 [Puccinia graminis f. sp. tritici CRL 75-36-700-3]
MTTILSKLSRFAPKPTNTKNFPQGFKVIGVHCGIKKKEKLDLGLLLSEREETSGAGCFTRNRFKAAPVKYSINKLLETQGHKIAGVVINSGCANAVTGTRGDSDAAEIARLVDEHLHKNGSASSLVLSTGVIGQLLPTERIHAGVIEGLKRLGDNYESWHALAEAFMTTDTFPKLLTHSFQLDGQEIRFAGIDKGAGMITLRWAHLMLPYSALSPPTPPSDRTRSNEHSPRQSIADQKRLEIFEHELASFALRLAKLVVRDGEGATKFVQVLVRGAQNEADATTIATTIATSSLVKCALNGEDANWGRILCALGYSPISHPIDTQKVSVSIRTADDLQQILLLSNGEPVPDIDELKAKEILKNEDLIIDLDLGHPIDHQASFYTCDLSKEYVAINADYRS